MPSAAPKVVSAEVVAAQPTDADRPMLTRLSSELNRRLPASAFIVKIRLDKVPEPTGDGWALYVGDTRIPKYWEYSGGIYFKVFDDTFLAEHQGKPLRFSHDDRTFVNTGVNLPGPEAPRPAASRGARRLPLQSEVLNDTVSERPSRARSARKRVVPASAGTRRRARKRKTSTSR
jgi:hypothetical protein